MASLAPIERGWRERFSYEALASLGRVGFAWEFLRRNRLYREQVARSPPPRISRGQPIATILVSDEQAELGARWGLHFRSRSRDQCSWCASPLA